MASRSATPLRLSEAWTIEGYMNMAPSCLDGVGCDAHVFPVDMSDGSQRTACLEHVPESSYAIACLIVSGAQDPIPMDTQLREIERALRFLGPAIRDMLLENSCRIIREGRAAA